MMNRTFEDGVRRRRLIRELGALLLGLVFAASVLGLVLSRPKGGATAAACAPVGVAVVAGDRPDADTAYVLDSCGRVQRRAVETAGPER